MYSSLTLLGDIVRTKFDINAYIHVAMIRLWHGAVHCTEDLELIITVDLCIIFDIISYYGTVVLLTVISH